MLSDRERRLLSALERRLTDEDPTLVRKFHDNGAAHPMRWNWLLETALGLLVLLAALALLFGSSSALLLSVCAAWVVALIRYRL